MEISHFLNRRRWRILDDIFGHFGEEFVGLQSQKLLTFSLPYSSLRLQELETVIEDDWLQVGPKQRVRNYEEDTCESKSN